MYSTSVRLLMLLIPLQLVLAAYPSSAHAMDPRFEIDPSLLDRKAATSGKSSSDQKAGMKQSQSASSGAADQTPFRKSMGRNPSSKRQPGHSFSLLRPHEKADKGQTVARAHEVWDRLVPSLSGRPSGVEIQGGNFELTIDPDRFPTLPAADGGTILVDAGAKLPPLVRGLIQDKGDGIRIVTADPSNRRHFFASLLSAARFHSVEENFSVDFGSDPQLSVSSDFKIEKTPESLMKRELVLLNVTDGRSGLPASLTSFLNHQGFEVLEPFAPGRRARQEGGHRLCQVGGGKAPEMADRLMSSLRLRYDRDTKVELFGPRDSGLRLDIRADRTFEVGKERYVVSLFNGDPVFYTLMRLLETRGYRVIILEEKDTFEKVAEKFMSRLRLSGSYAKHRLWPSQDAPYSVQLSGFMLRDAGSGKKIFLTDRTLDPLIAELATLNGYSVVTAQE